jgi:hypothetical protein
MSRMSQRRTATIFDLARERIKRRPVQPECPDDIPTYRLEVGGKEIAATEEQIFSWAQRGAEASLFVLNVGGHEVLVDEDRLFELAALGAAEVDDGQDEGGPDAA